MSFLNRSFEDSPSDITGWTAVNDSVISGDSITIGGQTFLSPVDTTYPDRLTDDSDNGNNDGFFGAGAPASFDAGTMRAGEWSFDSYLVGSWGSGNTYLSEVTDGDNAVRLISEGGVASGFGYGVIRGPWIYSSEFSASAGQSFTFDWQAKQGGDAFDVFGFLLNVDTGSSQIVLNETGSDVMSDGSGNWGSDTDGWQNAEVVLDTSGSHRFVFFSGSFDETGGRWLGASLYLDNFAGEAVLLGGSIESITDTGTLENGADEAGDGSSVNFVSETAELDESPVQVIDTRLADASTLATTVSDPFKELAFNGGDAADYVISGVFSDTIMTGGGNDRVISGNGDDIINTGSGNDVIYGGAGNNVIDAGSGDDAVVVGANETSTITLGAGADYVSVILTFQSPSFTSTSTVVDFSSAEGDILNFDYGLDDVSFAYQELTTSGEAGTVEGFEQALAAAEASNSGAGGVLGVVAVEANGGTYVFFDSGDQFGVTSSVLLSGATLDDLSANNIVL